MADCKINIMMFGGRRCGKTSVITAMNRNFEDVFGGKSDLVISQSDYDTMIAIEEKEQDLRSFFQDKKYSEFSTDGKYFTADGTEYLFDLQLKGRTKQDRITLSLYDFPGEWLYKKDKEKAKLLEDRMKTCGVIMIAIDTPYLMEPLAEVKKSEKNVGSWNDQRNYCQRVSKMVKNSFSSAQGLDKKMILFVPLKCEKYYANGEMDLVANKIQIAYKDLLNYVNKNSNYGKYEVVIAPILTLGVNTVFFSRFQEDEDGNPVMDSEKRFPVVPLFKFQDRNLDYSPRYCEQPLLYALSYLLYHVAEAKQKRANRSWFSKLGQAMGKMFRNWATAEDFLSQFDKVRASLKTSGDGYRILSDPLKLKV